MKRDKEEFIEAMLLWFKTPSVGNDDEINRVFLSDAYDVLTAPHWISVEDELPPMQDMSGQSEDVLVAFKYGVGVDYYDHGTNEWATGVSITHWMPLPSVEHLKKGGRE